MRSSKISMRKGHHLSIEGIQKGYLLCQKWYKKGKGVGPRGVYGAASPCIVNLFKNTPDKQTAVWIK